MGTELMAPRKNRFNRNPESEVIANNIIDAYKPSTVEEMQDAIREIFGPMFETMLKAGKFFSDTSPGNLTILQAICQLKH